MKTNVVLSTSLFFASLTSLVSLSALAQASDFDQSYQLNNNSYSTWIEEGKLPLKKSEVMGRLSPLTLKSEAALNCPTLNTGMIYEWPELGKPFYFDDITDKNTDISTFWSLSSYTRPAVYLYPENYSSEIALAPGVSDISEITDASSLNYDTWYVGPVTIDEFVVLHNIDTGYYAAIKVKDVIGDSFENAKLSATWYLQEDGSDDFSRCKYSEVEGCISLRSMPKGGHKVVMWQSIFRFETETDKRGCYDFENFFTGMPFEITISGEPER